MPRPPRIIKSGEFYHVMSRAHNRKWLFKAAADFEFYLEQISQYQEKFAVLTSHYCIMSNHVHLLLKSMKSDDGISRMMKGVNMKYAAYFQRNWGRSLKRQTVRGKNSHISREARKNEKLEDGKISWLRQNGGRRFFMPRPPRIIKSGEFYHVMSRAHNRKWLFKAAADFEFYLEQISQYQEKFVVLTSHYCIMSNHVHLLLKSMKSDDGISRMMKGVNMKYAAYFQRKYKSTGHVFENRFKSRHIPNDPYLLECGRYIERNPVRAKITGSPGDYQWSSYNYYAAGTSNLLLTPNPLYHGLGSQDKSRQAAYRAYVETSRAYEEIVDEYFGIKKGL